MHKHILTFFRNFAEKLFQGMINKGIFGKACALGVFLAMATPAMGEEELIKFGDFDTWITRDIKESALVGGKHQTIGIINQRIPRNSRLGLICLGKAAVDD